MEVMGWGLDLDAWTLSTEFFLKFDVQICRFWSILTVIESLVLADDPTWVSQMSDSGGGVQTSYVAFSYRSRAIFKGIYGFKPSPKILMNFKKKLVYFIWSNSSISARAVYVNCLDLFMVALCNRADHYIFILFLLLSSFLWSPYVIGRPYIVRYIVRPCMGDITV